MTPARALPLDPASWAQLDQLLPKGFTENINLFSKLLDKVKKMVYYSFVAVQDITLAYAAKFIESEADKVYKTYSLYSQSYIMESVCKTRFGMGK